MRPLVILAAAAAVIATPSLRAQQAPPPAPVVPAVGDVAPDFTAPAVGADGKVMPVSLAALKGKVVVLAFYPADRTSGCTAEMTKFRDDHAKLFGKDVVVLPISKDSLGSHASWAAEAKFPFALVSDTAGTVAQKYGSQAAPGRGFSRNVFVIGRDGHIAHVIVRLNALSEDAYTALGEAVAAARK